MSVATVAVQQATIRQYAKDLKLATVGGQFLSMAEEAVKEKQGHLSYLEALLGAEVEDRYQHGVARRITDAHFPKVKTLEDFAFSEAPHLSAAQIRNLAEGGYLSRSEPVIFLGETGTGKTLPEAAAELLFQIISGRAERAAVIVTTNLPFSEWTTMFPNARLCKAMLDRLTDQAHIIETGTESYRFRRTLNKKKGGKG
jgi:DNA replication protein DnaC